MAITEMTEEQAMNLEVFKLVQSDTAAGEGNRYAGISVPARQRNQQRGDSVWHQHRRGHTGERN